MTSCSLQKKFSSLEITNQTQRFTSPFPGFSPNGFLEVKKQQLVFCTSRVNYWGFLGFQ